MWYVSLMKKGTVETDTNYPPWHQCTPKAKWLEDMWAAQKLTEEQYAALSMQFGPGHSKRRRDALDVMRDGREEAVCRDVEAELKLLREAGVLRDAKSFAEVETFVEYFRGGPRLRRPALAIVGATNTGKSMLGGHVLQRVAEVLGLKEYLELTVEDSDVLDVGEFDRRTHAGVLLDGVGDAAFLKKHREVLQGRPKLCKGGKSGTMMYAYSFSLCRRAVVATFDLSAKNLGLLLTDHWLSDPRNVLVLRLREPAWDSGAAPSVVRRRSPLEEMRSWSVDALAEFFTSADLGGPAETLQRAGVNGADMVAWSAPAELGTDLKLLPFTARKLLACRDEFLGRDAL